MSAPAPSSPGLPRWLACLLLLIPAPALSQPLATLADPRINESSGLAPSRLTPGLLWTLNDSGGPATLFAIDTSGRTRAEIQVAPAVNIDWEDLASGPGHDGKPALFVADIGDNLKIRPAVQIYEIPEPPLNDSNTVHKIPPSRTWTLRYPDGPANAETLLCHPATGRLHILTKTFTGHAVLHAVPASHLPGQIQVLEKITTLTFPTLPKTGKRPVDNLMTTGGSLACDGSRLVIATYNSLYEWRLPDRDLTTEALAAEPLRIDPPHSRQMEAVCYDPGTISLYFTSEQLPAPLHRLAR